jgi:hypothetical protein
MSVLASSGFSYLDCSSEGSNRDTPYQIQHQSSLNELMIDLLSVTSMVDFVSRIKVLAWLSRTHNTKKKRQSNVYGNNNPKSSHTYNQERDEKLNQYIPMLFHAKPH